MVRAMKNIGRGDEGWCLWRCDVHFFALFFKQKHVKKRKEFFNNLRLVCDFNQSHVYS